MWRSPVVSPEAVVMEITKQEVRSPLLSAKTQPCSFLDWVVLMTLGRAAPLWSTTHAQLREVRWGRSGLGWRCSTGSMPAGYWLQLSHMTLFNWRDSWDLKLETQEEKGASQLAASSSLPQEGMSGLLSRVAHKHWEDTCSRQVNVPGQVPMSGRVHCFQAREIRLY